MCVCVCVFVCESVCVKRGEETLFCHVVDIENLFQDFLLKNTKEIVLKL